jgi:hypothetical protein
VSLFQTLESGDMVGVSVVSVRPHEVVCSVAFTIDDVDAEGGPRTVLLTVNEADDLAERLTSAARTLRGTGVKEPR